MNNKENEKLLKKFKEQCSVINLSVEYPGFIGKEKYCILTRLNYEELEEQFGQIVDGFKPYLIASPEIIEPIKEFKRNDNKFSKRSDRNTFSFEVFENTLEAGNELLISDPLTIMAENSEKESIKNLIHEVLKKLSAKQRERLLLFGTKGIPIKQIAKQEGVSESTVYKSIDLAKEKFKELFEKKLKNE